MKSILSTSQRIAAVSFLPSIVLFVSACFMPAIHDSEWGTLLGGGCLIFIPYCMAFPAWYANPIIFVGFLGAACGSSTALICVGIFATVLAASFSLLPHPNLRLQIGYWVWLASYLCFVLGAVRCHMLKPPEESSEFL